MDLETSGDRTHLYSESILQLDLQIRSEVARSVYINLEDFDASISKLQSLLFFMCMFANIVELVIFFIKVHSCKFGWNIYLIGWLAFDWYVIKACTILGLCDVSGLTHKCMQKALRSSDLILRCIQKWYLKIINVWLGKKIYIYIRDKVALSFRIKD